MDPPPAAPAAARDEEAGITPEMRSQRQRGSIPSFLILSFVLFLLTNHNGDEFLARHQYQDALQSLNYQLSNYTAWMNGTESNLTVPDQDPYVEPLLTSFVTFGGGLDSAWASYYSNITGFIRGDVQFHNITPAYLANTSATALPWKSRAEGYMGGTNATEIVDRIGTWNWTASDKVALSVVEKGPATEDGSEKIALIHGRIELTDANTSEDLRLEFEGVHFVGNGSIYGLAEPSGRHIDIRMLPSIVPDIAKNSTARIIEPELSARIAKLKTLIDAGVIDQDVSTGDEVPKSTCPFTFYAQIESSQIPLLRMQELESEIQKPTGIQTVDPPLMSIRGLLISKECGLLYEITKSEGLRSHTFFRKVTTYAGTAAVAYFMLVVLLSRQMERSRTPAGISRVSRWTFLSQAVVDSVSFAGYITFAILAEGRPSLSLIAPAFLACMMFIYEAQFSVLIYQIQLPENVVTVPPAPVPVPTPPQIAPVAATQDRADTLPFPAAQATPPPRQTRISFFLQHLLSDPQARLWVLLFLFLMLMVRVIISPTLAMLFVATTYSCFWLPQIVRSARRGRSSGLAAEYVVGTTICRLCFALYFLVYPKNVLDVEPRPWAFLLTAFVILQAAILILQEQISPTFFLPRRFAAVPIYDYHPPMPIPDTESPEQSLGDCAICMDAILVDPSLRRRNKSTDEHSEWDSSKDKGSSGGLLNAVQMGVSGRKNYSLAPCHHLFHTECLERWLAIKHICPQCRRPLPPL